MNNPKEDIHCVIISHVYKTHFHNLRTYLELKHKVYTKRFNCTIDNIVQYGNTLAVRLKLDLSKEKNEEGPDVQKVTGEYTK